MSPVLLAAMLIAPPATVSGERRLPPAEVERILEDAARKHSMADKPAPRAIGGEIGVSAATGGYGELFGTAVVPVGKDATAIISIGAENGERRKRRR